MSDPAIEVHELHRAFGRLQAVRGVSFAMNRGEVLGFIGANGSGKTTTMRMLATLDLPSAGSAKVCGYDVANFPNQVRQRIGWMPDAFGTYDDMTVLEYLDFFGRAFGYKSAERHRRVDEVMDFTNLRDIAERPMNKLSKGMSQRLCLGRTLLHDPEVLLLDEPAAGLDPQARLEFKQIVRLLAGDGKTIFISSHILSELEEMCDTILFIDAGRIVHHGSAEILKRGGRVTAVVDIEVAGEPDVLLRWISLNPGIALIEAGKRGARVRFDSGDPDQVAGSLRKMILDQVPVVEFRHEQRKLEDAFVDMLKKVQGTTGAR